MTLWRLLLPSGLSGRNGGRRSIEESLFDPCDEEFRLGGPRHANDSLLLWPFLLYGGGKQDHRYPSNLRCALAHSTQESLAHTLIHSGGEEQKVCTLKQLVDNPCGVGI